MNSHTIERIGVGMHRSKLKLRCTDAALLEYLGSLIEGRPVAPIDCTAPIPRGAEGIARS
jgi:hypothetical protein